MATIYVINDTINAGKVRYLAGAWPTNVPETGTANTTIVAAGTAAGVSGTVIIDGGTFTGTQLNAQQTLRYSTAALTIRGALPTDNAPNSGSTIIAGNGTAGVGVVRPDGAVTTLQNLTIQSDNDEAFGLIYTATANFIINLIDVYLNSGKYLINCSDSSGTSVINMTKVRFKYGTTSTKIAISIEGITLNGHNCIFDGNNTGAYLEIKGDTTINNSIFVNHISKTIYINGNPTVSKALELNNCILNANSLTGSTTNIIDKDAANSNMDIILNNCYNQPGPWAPDSYGYFDSGGTAYTQNDCVNEGGPRFVSAKYPAIMILTIDDIGAMASGYLAASRDIWEHYGYYGVWALNSTDTASAEVWAAAIDLVGAGHEVACHTRHHWPLATLTTFSVTKAGVSITIAGNTLTPTVGDPVNLTAYTLSSLKALLAAAPYSWTIGGTDPTPSTVPATVLADVAGQSINAAYTLNLDETKLFAANIDPSKSDIETNIPGYTCTAFVPPGNSTSANLRTYLKDTAGFVGSRGSSNDTLSSINIFNIGYKDMLAGLQTTTNYEASGGSRIDGMRRNFAALISKMQAQGGVYALYAHNTTELPIDELTVLCSELSQSGVMVKTLTEAIEYCKTYDPSGDIATADNLTYTRTLIDNSDYHLSASSMCKIGGINVGLTEDYEGNFVPFGGGYPIGPYRGPAVGGGLSPGLGLSGGNRPPWWRRRRR